MVLAGLEYSITLDATDLTNVREERFDDELFGDDKEYEHETKKSLFLIIGYRCCSSRPYFKSIQYIHDTRKK